jgi:hypothetical protein
MEATAKAITGVRIAICGRGLRQARSALAQDLYPNPTYGSSRRCCGNDRGSCSEARGREAGCPWGHPVVVETRPGGATNIGRRRRRGRSRTDTLAGHAGDIARGSTLLRLGRMAVDSSTIVSAAKASTLSLTILEINDRAVRDPYDSDLVLVRPDQHIPWRGNGVPADTRGLWRRVTGSG